MIKAEELRIGNLINYKGREIFVTMIGEFGIQSKSNDETINAKFRTFDLEPIPLTEDWLLNFGFIRVNTWEEWSKRNHVIKKKEYQYPLYDHTDINMYFYTSVIDRYFFFWGTHVNVNHINYVHQFQNLYFALTEKELTLKSND